MVLSTVALRKAKKNLKRVFNFSEDIIDCEELYNILSNNDFKTLIALHCNFESADVFYVSEDDKNAPELAEYIANNLGLLINDGHYLSETCSDLINIINKPHFRGLLYSLKEIATANFFTPSLSWAPTYVNDNNGTLDTNKDGKSNRNVLTSATNLKTASINSLSQINGGVARLTGGGEGLPVKPVDTSMKIISFIRSSNEGLGITIGVQDFESAQSGYVKEVYVKRVMAGSQIERQALLHEGDIIREINGVPIDRPETLQEQLTKSPETVTMKIIPAYKENKPKSQLYVRALYSYNPEIDNLLPCTEAGLPFKCYDILEILNQDDPNWWQARHYESDRHAGLIPSSFLQERRKAFVQSIPDSNAFNYKFLKGLVLKPKMKKTKAIFRARASDEFSSKDVIVYEEVALISGFQHPVVCLIGATGVGRQTLRDMIVEADPERYEVAIPYTSRAKFIDEEDGEEFFFESARKMEQAYQRNAFIEFGNVDGHYFGTKLKTVRRIVHSGKTCLLDCNPNALQILRTSEFMPYTVFLAAPSVSCLKAMYEYGRSMGFTEEWKRDDDFRHTLDESQRIERNYRHLFDKIIICDNIEVTFDRLKNTLDNLITQPQWVPAKWLY